MPCIAGMPIPSEVKKTVCFIYIAMPDGELKANGTGFFVSTQSPDKEVTHGYLVTANHVLKPKSKAPEYFPQVVLRLPKKEGGLGHIRVAINLEGANQTVFVHDDPTVDLAVIPALPDPELYDFLVLPVTYIPSDKEIEDLGVAEGSDVFFAGLFTPHTGKEHNYPIIRFGRVSLISEERINFMDKLRNIYLIETFSFGGNSGSPCFLYLGADRNPGSLNLGRPVLKLFGVISGTFQRGLPLMTLPTAAQELSLDNMGISAVVPSKLLMEILQSDVLKDSRGY